ncbi:MAG: hypothetical protein KGL39_34630 [Patescibacteria group bacterium]|nr:hypothetical protein [Patescibacteria group bacterium]
MMLDQNGRQVDEGYRFLESDSVTVTTAGTPVQLSAVSAQVKRIDITADYNNSDMVVIGGSGVVGPEIGRKGVPLAPGNTYTFYITDLALVWMDAAANGQKATYNAFY